MDSITPDRIVTIRVPRIVADEVRRIAERDAETQSTVFRQLIKLGLRTARDRRDLEAGR